MILNHHHYIGKQQANVVSQANKSSFLKVYFFDKAYDQQSNYNLVSVIKVSSLSVKHDFSISFKKPNPCTRYVTLFCVPEFAQRQKEERQVVISQRIMLYQLKQEMELP